MQKSSLLLVPGLLFSLVLASCGTDFILPDEVQFEQVPDEITNSTKAIFGFIAEEPETTTFECQLDGEERFTCVSPLEIEVTEGEHKFRVYGRKKGRGNVGVITHAWRVDTTAPETTITTPTVSISTVSEMSLEFVANEDHVYFFCSIDGAQYSDCDTGVTFTGLADGAHVLSVYAQDEAGNKDLSPATYGWTSDLNPPPAVTVIAPGQSPYVSAGSALVLSGACKPGATVKLVDGTTFGEELAPCILAAYSFTISKSQNGIFPFTLTQTDSIGRTSPSVQWQWMRDASLPSTPTITTPSTQTLYSNNDSATISGGCTSGNTVNLSGSATDSRVCSSSGTYNFTAYATTDGMYTYAVSQTNGMGITSGTATVVWERDTTAPSAPTITSPSNPYTSSDSMIAISGTCELGAKVDLLESTTIISSTICEGSAYTVTALKTSDATYQFTLRQTDRATNQSGSTAFQWTRSASAPPTVLSVNPAMGSIDGGTQITIAGAGFGIGGTPMITVGGKPCTNVALSSSTEVVCDTPARLSSGVQSIVVTNPGGNPGTGVNLFTYTGAATLTKLRMAIFNSSCNSCHYSGDTSGGLDMTSFSSLSGRVVPGNASGSLLYKRITTQSPLMPKGGAMLTPEEQKAVADWIDAGGMNN